MFFLVHFSAFPTGNRKERKQRETESENSCWEATSDDERQPDRCSLLLLLCTALRPRADASYACCDSARKHDDPEKNNHQADDILFFFVAFSPFFFLYRLFRRVETILGCAPDLNEFKRFKWPSYASGLCGLFTGVYSVEEKKTQQQPRRDSSVLPVCVGT